MLVWFFAAVTLTLTWWSWYTNFTLIFWKCICIPKVKFLGLGFQKLEHKQTERYTIRRDQMYYQPHSRVWNISTAVLVMRCVNGRGVCTQAPCYCIVMEYCPNGQLYEVLRNNHLLSSTLLVSWAQQIASGMSYVHSQKIIHRDLKSPKLVFTISN